LGSSRNSQIDHHGAGAGIGWGTSQPTTPRASVLGMTAEEIADLLARGVVGCEVPHPIPAPAP
jgi:hypothetical protein